MLRKLFNSTTLIFAAIVGLVVFWIGGGMLGREAPVVPERPEPGLPSVAVSTSRAEEITRELSLYGDVAPVQVATVRARTDGTVEAIVDEGLRVEPGTELARLSSDDRDAREARAQAQVASAQRDYESALQLFERNVGPQANVQTTLAQLEAARAELRSIELEIENTILTAPIEGVVNQIFADLGAYVGVGGEVLEIVDNDPLLAVVNVQQSAISRVRVGQPATVTFIGGETRDGHVRFVSPIADAATRTFRVEIEVPNPERDLAAGLSAEVVIPVETLQAHRISPALGRLDGEGRLGIYTVGEDDRLNFQPIEILRAETDGIWVTGLADSERIVTISQGMLNPGQPVAVRPTPEGYLRDLASDAAVLPGAQASTAGVAGEADERP